MATIAHWPHRPDQPRRAQRWLVELTQGSAETREALAQHRFGRASGLLRAAGELEAVAGHEQHALFLQQLDAELLVVHGNIPLDVGH